MVEALESKRRYSRHTVLKEIGEAGQVRLGQSSVLVIGAGGLGAPALAYLAAAGIGKLGIVEADRVELSNLQRQILFETADIDQPKARAAKARLEEMNPDCDVTIYEQRFADNDAALIAAYDVVLDCTDNFDSRFAIADACYAQETPLVSAAVVGFDGQITTFKPYLGSPHPSYRCLVHSQPEQERSCAQEGIVGPLAGVLGSMQALEAIKELLAIGTSLSGRIVLIDGLSMAIREVALPRDDKQALRKSA